MNVSKGKNTGFSLIELLMAVAIVGILAAVAYPSYQDSLTKSRRADAKAAISAAVMAQEKWYFQFNGYADDVDDIGGDGSNTLLSPEGYYSLAINNNSGTGTCVGGGTVRYNCYTLTASPVSGGAQASDSDCTSFSITHTGVKSATGSSSGECW